jgi:hypothetical protein
LSFFKGFFLFSVFGFKLLIYRKQFFKSKFLNFVLNICLENIYLKKIFLSI